MAHDNHMWKARPRRYAAQGRATLSINLVAMGLKEGFDQEMPVVQPIEDGRPGSPVSDHPRGGLQRSDVRCRSTTAPDIRHRESEINP
jgi:hypothetical protein